MAFKEADQYMKPHGEEGIEVIKQMNETMLTSPNSHLSALKLEKRITSWISAVEVESTLKNSLKEQLEMLMVLITLKSLWPKALNRIEVKSIMEDVKLSRLTSPTCQSKTKHMNLQVPFQQYFSGQI